MHIPNTLKGKLNIQYNINKSWLVTTIKAILKTQIQKSEKPIFSFRREHESEDRNSKTLTAFKGDLDTEISAQKYSPVNYGSEFRDTAALEKFFSYHEDRTNIINIIQQGSLYHLNSIEEETQKSDLDAMILRGNHK